MPKKKKMYKKKKRKKRKKTDIQRSASAIFCGHRLFCMQALLTCNLSTLHWCRYKGFTFSLSIDRSYAEHVLDAGLAWWRFDTCTFDLVHL